MYYLLPLLDTVDDDDIDINESTVVWILVVVLLVCLIVFVVDRMRRP